MPRRLEIDWKDNQTDKGGTILTIKIDSQSEIAQDDTTINEKHYSAEKLSEALEAVKKAIDKVRFDNLPDRHGPV